MLEKFGGRKFIFAILIAIGLLTLAMTGKINYDQLMAGWLWAFGIFAVANASQGFISE